MAVAPNGALNAHWLPMSDALHDLEARAAIEDLLYLYPLYMRSGIETEVANLYTEDAIFEQWGTTGLGRESRVLRRRLIGRDAVLDSLINAGSSGYRMLPMIHNIHIQVHGNTAESHCEMVAASWPGSSRWVGEYHDHYRLEDRWRFCKRIYALLGEITEYGGFFEYNSDDAIFALSSEERELVSTGQAATLFEAAQILIDRQNANPKI